MFSNATEVIVSGSSAGGVASYTWANYIAERVINGRVRVFADVPIFYDSYNVKTNQQDYKTSLANLMKFSNDEIDPPIP